MCTKVLIDGPSYHIYRTTTTLAWWGHAQHDVVPSIDNALFLETMEKQCLQHLEKFAKMIKIPINQMIFAKDCPREEIWRCKLYAEYKANRPSGPLKPGQIDMGAIVKSLNEKMYKRYQQIIRVPETESDDIIAILTKLYLAMDTETRVVIVTGDSDFDQLLANSRVQIYRPKGWTRVNCPDPAAALASKIAKGDKSDNIGSTKSRTDPNVEPFEISLRNRQLIDFDYIPRWIQDRVIIASGISLYQIPSNFRPKSIQLGLCCINTALQSRKIFCSRKPILRTIERDGVQKLIDSAAQNIRDLMKMIEWNAENGVRVLRISSELCPHKANPKAPSYSLDTVQALLDQAGQLARTHKQRLTFHPGQYNVIGTPDENTFKQTASDLDYHAEVLDRMGCLPDSVIVIHGGGVYKSKTTTMVRWCQNFKRLSSRVQRRLVLENCEKSYSIADCLEISKVTGVPVVLDTHHYSCYVELHPPGGSDLPLRPASEYIPDILATWAARGIKPKFHVSTQGSGQIGHHADYIDEIPEYLLEIPEKYHVDIDIMIEAKQKELAIARLYTKYPQLNPLVAYVPTRTYDDSDDDIIITLSESDSDDDISITLSESDIDDRTTISE